MASPYSADAHQRLAQLRVIHKSGYQKKEQFLFPSQLSVSAPSILSLPTPSTQSTANRGPGCELVRADLRDARASARLAVGGVAALGRSARRRAAADHSGAVQPLLSAAALLRLGGDAAAARGCEALALRARADAAAANVGVARKERDYVACEAFAKSARLDYAAAETLLKSARFGNGQDLFDFQGNVSMPAPSGSALAARLRARAELSAAYALSPRGNAANAALVREGHSARDVARGVATEDSIALSVSLSQALRGRDYAKADAARADAVAAVAKSSLAEDTANARQAFEAAAAVGARISDARSASRGDAALEKLARSCVPFAPKDVPNLRLLLLEATNAYRTAADARGADVAQRAAAALEAIVSADSAWSAVSAHLRDRRYGAASRMLRKTVAALRAATARIPLLNATVDAIAQALASSGISPLGMIATLAAQDGAAAAKRVRSLLGDDQGSTVVETTDRLTSARFQAEIARTCFGWALKADGDGPARAAAAVDAAEVRSAATAPDSDLFKLSSALAESDVSDVGDVLGGIDGEGGSGLRGFGGVGAADAQGSDGADDYASLFRLLSDIEAADDAEEASGPALYAESSLEADVLLQRFLRRFRPPKRPTPMSQQLESAQSRRRSTLRALAALAEDEAEIELLLAARRANAFLARADASLSEFGKFQIAEFGKFQIAELQQAEDIFASNGLEDRALIVRRRRFEALASEAEYRAANADDAQAGLRAAQEAVSHRRETGDARLADDAEKVRAGLERRICLKRAEEAFLERDYWTAVHALDLAATHKTAERGDPTSPSRAASRAADSLGGALEAVRSRAVEDGRAKKAKALEALVAGDLQAAKSLADVADVCFTWAAGSPQPSADAAILGVGTRHSVDEVFIAIAFVNDEAQGAALLQEADAFLRLGDGAAAAAALEKAAEKFHGAQASQTHLLHLAQSHLRRCGGTADGADREAALQLQACIASLRKTATFDGGRGASRAAAQLAALAIDKGLEEDMPPLLVAAAQRQRYDDVLLRLTAAREAYTSLKRQAQGRSGTDSRLSKLELYDAFVDSLAMHAAAQKVRDYTASVAHLQKAEVALSALRAASPRTLRPPQAPTAAPAVCSVILSAVAAGYSATATATKCFATGDFPSAFAALDDADASFGWAAEQRHVVSALAGCDGCSAAKEAVDGVLEAERASVTDVPEILHVSKPAHEKTFVGFLRSKALSAKARAMGAAKRIEAVECRLRADFPTALLLLGEAADLLRHAAPAEMAPKAPLQQGSSGALGNSKSQRGGSFSDFSGAFGMCDSGGGDLDVSSIHALASGVRGDSALAAALGFYAAGDLLKAHARLIDPDGAVALYTRASEVCAIHEASALVAKVEAEMIFRGFAPALAENDFDSALDILTRSRTKYHFFLKHATPRIAAIKSSKELFQQVQPLPFVAAAARRLGDKSKADATTALYKAKDTLQAQKCLDAATRCFQWASRGRADTQASLDGLRAEIAVHVFKDRAEACLSSAFSAVAAVDVTGSAEAHETALSELLEAFELFSCAACSKESADVRKLQHAIQADQTLRNAVEAMTNPTHARAPNAPKAFSPEDLPESDAQPESDALMHSTAPASKAPAPAPDEPLVQKTRAPFSDMLAALAKSRSSLKAVCGLRATTLRRWIARGAERLDQVTKIEGFLVSAAKFDPTTYTVAPVKNRRAPKATVELTAQLAHMSNLQDSLGEIQALKGTLVVPLALLQAELHRLQIILDPFAADRAVKAT